MKTFYYISWYDSNGGLHHSVIDHDLPAWLFAAVKRGCKLVHHLQISEGQFRGLLHLMDQQKNSSNPEPAP